MLCVFPAYAQHDSFWEHIEFGMSPDEIYSLAEESYSSVIIRGEVTDHPEVEYINFIIEEIFGVELNAVYFYFFENKLFSMEFLLGIGCEGRTQYDAVSSIMLKQLENRLGQPHVTKEDQLFAKLPEKYHDIIVNEAKSCANGIVGSIGGLIDYAQWVYENGDGSFELVDYTYRYYGNSGYVEIDYTQYDAYTAALSLQ